MDANMLQQLLDKFTAEEAVIIEELALVQEQITQLETRLEECASKRDKIALDRESLLGIAGRYANGQVVPIPEIAERVRLEAMDREAMEREALEGGAAGSVPLAGPAPEPATAYAHEPHEAPQAPDDPVLESEPETEIAERESSGYMISGAESPQAEMEPTEPGADYSLQPGGEAEQETVLEQEEVADSEVAPLPPEPAAAPPAPPLEPRPRPGRDRGQPAAGTAPASPPEPDEPKVPAVKPVFRRKGKQEARVAEPAALESPAASAPVQPSAPVPDQPAAAAGSDQSPWGTDDAAWGTPLDAQSETQDDSAQQPAGADQNADHPQAAASEDSQDINVGEQQDESDSETVKSINDALRSLFKL